MKLAQVFSRGLIKENPVFVLLLGLCPTLAVTTGLKNAIGMGLASTFVLVCSNLVVSIAKKAIPAEVRIPVYIVIIATFVTIVKLSMYAYVPEIAAALGIFLPLIVVNCVILGRAEAFASKSSPVSSIVDGLGMGLGFTGALSLIGVFREVLGAGTVWDIPIAHGLNAISLDIFIIAPGGFLAMGLLLGLFNYISIRKQKKAEIEASHKIGADAATATE